MSDLFFDSIHAGLGQVLDLRAAQHSLTATNLANSDTPGFEARYIPFDRILSEAMDSGEGLSMRRTHELHVSGPGGNPEDPEVETLEAPPWSEDGNSVVLEKESVRLSENALLFNTVATGLSRRMAMMRYAASDGRA
jgi:flagellar basal-body rod protein FlgB